MTSNANMPQRRERKPVSCPGCDFVAGEPSRSCKCVDKKMLHKRNRREAAQLLRVALRTAVNAGK